LRKKVNQFTAARSWHSDPGLRQAVPLAATSMRLSTRHIGLIAGMLSILISFLFFGRRQDVYSVLLIIGSFLAILCFLWIIIGKGTIREKMFWTFIVAFGVFLNWLTESYFINASYRIYLSQHSQEMEIVNEILKSKPGRIWILNDSIKEDPAQVLSVSERDRLLQERRKLGVYLISKGDSTIYYGLWGFLDVRLGLTYSISGKKLNGQYKHLSESWYH
jgi:hypothetical protein